MKFRILLVFLCCTAFMPAARSQVFGFHKNDTVTVIEGADTLAYAWAGGLNYGQLSAIDMDFDGDKDLFVFDRTGNRWITLENRGTPNKTDYAVADRFRGAFPPLTDWALLVDYDGDGKEDIFGYTNGGVKVYRNTGDAVNGLSFTLVKPQVYSDYNPNLIILYISLADLPAITDVDGDSDVDILTFSSSGGCVEYHKNLSMELYGNNDSLVYKRVSDNWGNFTEGASGYDIALSDSCDTLGQAPGGLRHAGSSLLAVDLDGDADKDLVLGDIGGFNLTALRNDGSATYANMGNVDFNFPQNNTSTVPVNLTLFPAAFYVDVDNDNKRDIIVTPNATGSSETAAGTWHYRNDGTDASPDLKLVEQDFLQGEMIELGEGSFPRFFDYDRDGLTDLVIGNSSYWAGNGQLALYKNTGTASQPKFTLVTRNLANVGSLSYKSIIPAFGDMDGDGDDDMIIGEVTGYIHYFQNSAPVAPNSPAIFTLTTTQYFGIKENSFSAPFIIDLDQDGKNDIVCGGRLGKLNYYRNTGTTAAASFSSVPTITTLGNVDVTDITISSSGYSVPAFFTHNSKLELMVGSLRGNIRHYTDIYDVSNTIQANFTLQDANAGYIWDGIRSGVSVADIDADNYPDLVMGNYSGGVGLYMGHFTAVGTGPEASTGNGWIIYPNPSSDRVRLQQDAPYAYTGNISLSVMDITGREVYRHPAVIPGMTVDMSGWTPGFYIFALRPAHGPASVQTVIKTNE